MKVFYLSDLQMVKMGSVAYMRAVFIVIGCGLLAPVVALGQGRSSTADHVLDLLVRPLPAASAQAMSDADRDLRSWLMPPPPSDSAPVSQFPFDVTLLSIDREGYALGERLIFELLLRNNTGAPIDMPWSSDGSGISHTMAGARRLDLSLTFKHPVLGPQAFATQTVFGSDAVPGSLRTIMPNETVLIRAGGLVQLQGARTGSRRENWAHNVRLKASMILSDRSHYYPPGASQNELGVIVAKK